MGVTICKLQPTFIVIEQVHSKPGMPAQGNTIGPSLQQIYRRIVQVCNVEDTYFRGQRLDGAPSIWQYIQEYLLPGQRITTQATEEKRFVLIYAGFRNILQPLPWTEKYDLGLPPVSVFTYGADPIPSVQLYGNARAEFISPRGMDMPTAVAVYHQGPRALEYPAVTERDAVLRRLLSH